MDEPKVNNKTTFAYPAGWQAAPARWHRPRQRKKKL